MVTRFLSSAAAGLAVTTALLWIMNALIEVSEAVETPGHKPWALSFLPTIDDSDTIIDELSVEHTIDDPVRPPPTVPPPEIDGDPGYLPVPPAPPPPGRAGVDRGAPGFTDGALINIINAQPEYPVTLSQRGIEGYVIVRFDIAADGSVDNVEVVESSHRGFEKAAIKAAYRSRYKPQVVDGVALPTTGLQKLFRFEMEN